MSFSPQPTSSASDGSGSASTPTAGSATCLALLLDSEIEADLADALHVVLEPGGVTGHPPSSGAFAVIACDPNRSMVAPPLPTLPG